ncbi:ribbon-helix-helix domain-containing protein [Ahrensia sp. R2A130]|uniref:ribbon-helix-helix domain-containing protein n=1 Tax=Ahrensia sp. R2A130 TaxID=744979 RepID=UPI0001E0F85F|nr:ribbon-helix-helix domain-containing protein [Ahrensia sp. R2A130]EFL89470.1 hypothetical protein R2A130_2079 [Ahrensia sp. R2A130]
MSIVQDQEADTTFVDLLGDEKPEFRGVTVEGQRYGVRLETGFWEAIREIGSRYGQDKNWFVREALKHGREDGNLTSKLRVACLSWFVQQYEANAEENSRRRLRSLLASCATPAIVLGEEGSVEDFNSGYVQLLEQRKRVLEASTVAEAVAVKFTRPLDEIRTELLTLETAALRDIMTSELGNFSIDSNVRLALDPSPNSGRIVVFVN